MKTTKTLKGIAQAAVMICAFASVGLADDGIITTGGDRTPPPPPPPATQSADASDDSSLATVLYDAALDIWTAIVSG